MDNCDNYPRLSQAILLCLALFAMVFLLSVLMGIVDYIIGYEKTVGDPAVQLLSFLLVLRWACRKTNQKASEVFPFTPFQLGIIFPMAILLIGVHLIGSEVDNILRYFLPMPLFLTELFEELIGSGFKSIILCVILAPVTEELVFRGIILRGFLRHFGQWKAIIISALLFSFFHLNPYQFFPAFVVGSISGWLYLKTGSLWPCIFAHAFFNSLGFIATGLFPEIPGYTSGISTDIHVLFQPMWLDIFGVICIVSGMLTLAKITANESTAAGQALQLGAQKTAPG